MTKATELWNTHPDAAILEEITYGNGKQVVLVRDRHFKIIYQETL